MNELTAVLYFFIIVATCSSLLILFARKVFHAVILLLVCLVAVAGIYVILSAEFVAMVQLLIYAGGVVVLIIFAIMLTARTSAEPQTVASQHQLAGYILGVALFLLLIIAVPSQEIIAPSLYSTFTLIGVNLFTVYVAPFEAAGLLLLVSLIGAAVVSGKKFKKS